MPASRDWNRQRDFLRKTYNKEVKRWFRDLGDSEDLGFNTPRAAVFEACLISYKDSQNMALLKMRTFDRVVQKNHLKPHVYAAPTTEPRTYRRFRPQIILRFLQDSYRNYEISKAPGEGRISFRLMNETSKTITQTEVTKLANAVKREFMSGKGHVWSKGRVMYAYNDWDIGYQLQLLCYSETEAKTLIRKVLSIQDHTPEWTNLAISKVDSELSAYPSVPETEVILGKSERMPKRRPVVDVRFTHAELHLYGLKEPVILCDRTHRFVNPVVLAG